MSKLNLVKLGALALVAIVAGCTKQVSFKNDIFPILKERCFVCHAPGAPGCLTSGLSMESYASLMKGTKFGPMIIPGNSLDSNLLRLVKHQADPSIAMPKSQKPGEPSGWLKPGQISLIETWINQGAKDN